MDSLVTLAQALGLSYASGVNLYATVALVGLTSRAGWIGTLPGALEPLASPWIIGIALVMFVVEFIATLVPGVASAWDTVHTAIRPPAAAALAVLTAWQGDPLFITVAALLGGGLAVTTHATKLGLRYAVDTSPEPVTNAGMNVAELGVVASLAFFIWEHPFVALAAALGLLAGLIIAVRLVWRSIGRMFKRVLPGNRSAST